MTLVQILELQVHDFGVTLLDLIKKDNGLRVPANLFGKLACIVIAHISRR